MKVSQVQHGVRAGSNFTFTEVHQEEYGLDAMLASSELLPVVDVEP